ncbi:hypothetical protein [Rhizobium leguminosarum]
MTIETELPAVKVPELGSRPSYCEPLRFLLLASYCGGDNDNCSEQRPCQDCLAMCNIYDENGQYVSELGKSLTLKDDPGNGEAERLTRLARPIIGIENRTPLEVFDIMADRIRATLRKGDK